MPALRKGLFVAFLLACVASVYAQPAPHAADETSRVQAVAAIGMTVSDLPRAVAFYTDVLSFEKVGDEIEVPAETLRSLYDLPNAKAHRVRLRLGNELLELTAFDASRGRSFPSDTRSNDHWFQHVAIVVRDMDRAYARLQARGVQAASQGGPQRLPDWNKNAGGIRAFYFRDPDGHFLELLEFPHDKGAPQWHRDGAADAPLFLGIDHTAIVVADTDASLRFYRDTLGLRVAGTNENYGPEQERLNNVPGARLRITTLRAEDGPGIELLEYQAPKDGRPYPADTRAHDAWYWQTTLLAHDRRGARLLHDPTGHVLLVTRE